MPSMSPNGAQPATAGWAPAHTTRVLTDVLWERRKQEAKYGHRNADLVDGSGPDTRWLLPYTTDSAVEIEARVRQDYEEFEEEVGLPTRVHLLREEMAEAFLEDDPVRLEEELIQVAALAVQWVESLRARRKPCEDCAGTGTPQQYEDVHGGAEACSTCQGLGHVTP